MKIEMICTGEEVLLGQILNTNATWFANALLDHGYELQTCTTVGDRLDDLVSIFRQRSQYADIIIVNGGLGPTSDDLSAQAMALAKGEELTENSLWRDHLVRWYASQDRFVDEANLKQAMLPTSAVIVDNPIGTACGFRVKLNGAWLFFTPGVPVEFERMITEQLFDFIRQQDESSPKTEVLKLLTLGYGESTLASMLEALTLPDGVTLGYRSFIPYVEVKLFGRGVAAIEQLPEVIQLLKATLGDAVVGEDVSSLAPVVHQQLIDAGLSLSIAESCTGGMLTSNLIALAGSSAYLHQGLVTYSNAAKVKLLGVDPKTIAEQGAVSIATVTEMASGVRRILDSDYGLATSGIAGPDGGSELKPVGTVALALATRNTVYSQILVLTARSRESVRAIATAIALDMLRRERLKLPVIADYNLYRPLVNLNLG